MKILYPLPMHLPGVSIEKNHAVLDLKNDELRKLIITLYFQTQQFLQYAGYDDTDPASTAAQEMHRVLKQLQGRDG